MAPTDTPLVVLTTGYRAEAWIVACLRSAMRPYQTRNPLAHVALLDDPDTLEIARQYLLERGGEALHATAAPGYGTALEGVWRTCHSLPPETVVCWLDADDWLLPDALETVAAAYAEDDVWLTYGQFWFCQWTGEGWRRSNGVATPYPDDVVRRGAYRADPWRASHLKTWRAGLFHQIKEADLKRPDGTWITEATDLAVMFPLLEMAGERHRCVLNPIYEYNCANPQSIFNMAPEERDKRQAYQLAEDARIRDLPRYERLEVRPW
jgi:hypothetical protein